MDSYVNANVKVVTLNGITDKIRIARGLKQGCPLSPLLFDICLDPLIERLALDEFRDCGFYWGLNKEDGVTAQA
jgi:hypothetical protein